MRYLVDSRHYNASQGPILMYTGNEGGIWAFYNNSGFITDNLAKKYGALVVFAEHRYYGKSWPFGTAAESMKEGNTKFLTVPQVLRDFVGLIRMLKTDESRPELANRAVIVGGGSYGGMLSAWMRMKYPNHVQGALASSAPVRWFNGTTNPNTWTKIASHVIEKQGGQMCYYQYKYGFYDLTSCVYDQFKWPKIKEIFGLCAVPTKPDEINTLIDTIAGSLGGMVQVNYPYAADMGGDLPAWPTKAACDAAAAYPAAENLEAVQSVFNFTNIEAIGRAFQVSFNHSGDASCIDVDGSPGGSTPSDIPFGWTI